MLFSHRNGLTKYLTNTSWLILERFFRLGIGLIIVVVIARYLGPEQFGLLSYSISFVGLFAAFATLGLDGVVVKKLVENKVNSDIVLGSAFFLKLTGSITGFLLIVLIFPVFGAEEARNLTYLIALMGFFQASNVIDLYFQSIVKVKYVVFVQIVQTILAAVLRLYLIYIKAELIWFAAFYVFDAAILAAGLALIYRSKKGSFFLWKWNFLIAKELLNNSWPLIISGVIISIYMKIDQIMIQALIDNHAVGIYAAATRLGEVPYVVPMLVTASLFPAIINAKKHSYSIYKHRMSLLYSLMFILAAFIVVIVIFLADWLISTFYGSVYNDSSLILKIHIMGCFFVFWGISLSRWVMSENLQKKEFLYHLMGLISNIILNLILIPRNGIVGAALATVISQFLSNMLFPLVMGKEFRAQIALQLKSMTYLPVHVLNYIKNEQK